ncbi:MAG: glycosyltransferase, partial [Solirubrobacterales bacterium]|nr:glycosyltransferase [Solirubrobacterales bacterium]
MRVVVVAEFYPRAADPVLGVWAHRQALAARDAGADVRVVVLHRVVAPQSRARDLRAWREVAAQPARAELDGLDVRYVRFVSPPRGRHYARWGAYAAPPLALALRRLRRARPYDLVHAHYAAPAADAVLRARAGAPLVISEHGGDVFHTAKLPGGEAIVRRAFGAARLVLANSQGIEQAVRALGAQIERRSLRRLGRHDLDDRLGIDPRPVRGEREPDAGAEALGELGELHRRAG